jgi:hypothetical protein
MSSLIFKGDNLCGDDNGMCSHMCFPLPAYDSTSKSTKIECMCPDFFIVKADNNAIASVRKSDPQGTRYLVQLNATSERSISQRQ